MFKHFALLTFVATLVLHAFPADTTNVVCAVTHSAAPAVWRAAGFELVRYRGCTNGASWYSVVKDGIVYKGAVVIVPGSPDIFDWHYGIFDLTKITK